MRSKRRRFLIERNRQIVFTSIYRRIKICCIESHMTECISSRIWMVFRGTMIPKHTVSDPSSRRLRLSFPHTILALLPPESEEQGAVYEGGMDSAGWQEAVEGQENTQQKPSISDRKKSADRFGSSAARIRIFAFFHFSFPV